MWNANWIAKNIVLVVGVLAVTACSPVTPSDHASLDPVSSVAHQMCRGEIDFADSDRRDQFLIRNSPTLARLAWQEEFYLTADDSIVLTAVMRHRNCGLVSLETYGLRNSGLHAIATSVSSEDVIRERFAEILQARSSAEAIRGCVIRLQESGEDNLGKFMRFLPFTGLTGRVTHTLFRR